MALSASQILGGYTAITGNTTDVEFRADVLVQYDKLVALIPDPVDESPGLTTQSAGVAAGNQFFHMIPPVALLQLRAELAALRAIIAAGT